jgi:hypothetical protein
MRNGALNFDLPNFSTAAKLSFTDLNFPEWSDASESFPDEAGVPSPAVSTALGKARHPTHWLLELGSGQHVSTEAVVTMEKRRRWPYN